MVVIRVVIIDVVIIGVVIMVVVSSVSTPLLPPPVLMSPRSMKTSTGQKKMMQRQASNMRPILGEKISVEILTSSD